jgi:hypothetical protein
VETAALGCPAGRSPAAAVATPTNHSALTGNDESPRHVPMGTGETQVPFKFLPEDFGFFGETLGLFFCFPFFVAFLGTLNKAFIPCSKFSCASGPSRIRVFS